VRRCRCKVSMLPQEIREEINIKLCNGERFDQIRQWLFEKRVESDVPHLRLKAGDCYSLFWMRDCKHESVARNSCQHSLSTWFRTGHQQWLRDAAERDESIQLLEHVERLSSAAGEKTQPDSSIGGNALIRSLLFETIQSIRKDGNDSVKIARLANAWARLNQTATGVEALKLRKQEAIDIGLQALLDEAKGNPKAIEQFNKFHDLVKRSAKRRR
jgi:hypothetical protein